MKIAIYSRFLKKDHISFVQILFDILAQRDAELFIFEEYYQSFDDRIRIQQKLELFKEHEDFKAQNIDFMISLGGDGTILDLVTIVRDTGVPIMGINLGRLGFLAMIEKNRIEQALDALYSDSFTLDQRSILYLESSPSIFGDKNFALNDFTILKRDTSSMVIIHTYVNGEFLNSYWADGIIVATPTGSTGYSLSCGGPIIFPKSGNFIITPVAPHNLNVRPIVLSDNAVISFEVEGRAKNFLCTLDSRYETIDTHFQLAVRKADFQVNLVRFTDRNFLYMIREKLKWGIDSRNY
ncbi:MULTISPECIES: NAD kinase [unclassified Aureispira]|uniref:NAD kinase n=1 Tax=unclassified Aureispira TaxID=2649989 RepID=UPI000698656B|nr:MULTISPECIES: NAD kinase [unclassified Aureispira]WMX14548.1 NAD kinase [Aureispira sp. CCB-E]